MKFKYQILRRSFKNLNRFLIAFKEEEKIVLKYIE